MPLLRFRLPLIVDALQRVPRGGLTSSALSALAISRGVVPAT